MNVQVLFINVFITGDVIIFYIIFFTIYSYVVSSEPRSSLPSFWSSNSIITAKISRALRNFFSSSISDFYFQKLTNKQKCTRNQIENFTRSPTRHKYVLIHCSCLCLAQGQSVPPKKHCMLLKQKSGSNGPSFYIMLKLKKYYFLRITKKSKKVDKG